MEVTSWTTPPPDSPSLVSPLKDAPIHGGATATLDFLRGKVPKKWGSFRNSLTRSFRAITPRIFGF